MISKTHININTLETITKLAENHISIQTKINCRFERITKIHQLESSFHSIILSTITELNTVIQNLEENNLEHTNETIEIHQQYPCITYIKQTHIQKRIHTQRNCYKHLERCKKLIKTIREQIRKLQDLQSENQDRLLNELNNIQIHISPPIIITQNRILESENNSTPVP